MNSSRHEHVLAVVIGRAGSRGLPGKNGLPVAGVPMIARSIACARSAHSVHDIVVSTDGEELQRIAADAEVRVIDRPAELATDEATVADTVRHAVLNTTPDADIVVILYANIPVRPPGLIDRAVAMLQTSGADSVQSYAPVGKYHPWWMITLDEQQRVTPLHTNRVDRRQDLPPVRIPDGGVLAVRRAALMTQRPGEPHAFLGEDRRGIETELGAVVDVDSPIDLLVAEARIREEATDL